MTTQAETGIRFSCLPKNLIAGLDAVSRAVATRPMLPILTHVCITTDKSRLKISAMNLEIAISCWIGAKVESEGAIVVPHGLISRLAKSLIGTNDKIDARLTTKGKSLELKCDKTETRISGMDADDFPPIPAVQNTKKVYIEPGVLTQAVTRVAFAAAPAGADRYVLTGILMEFDGEYLTMVGANGYQLAVQKIKIPKIQEAFSIIVPAPALQELSRLLAEQAEPVEITVNANKSQILFMMKDIELVSQLLQGQYPNYKPLIPQTSATRATINSDEFRSAVKRSAIFAGSKEGSVRLEVSEDAMSVFSHSDEMGNSRTDISASIAGDASKIALRVDQLAGVLAVLEGNVTIEINSPTRPIVIRQDGDVDYLCVQMPMVIMI